MVFFSCQFVLAPSSLACSAGVFWVGESLLIGSLRWTAGYKLSSNIIVETVSYKLPV